MLYNARLMIGTQEIETGYQDDEKHRVGCLVKDISRDTGSPGSGVRQDLRTVECRIYGECATTRGVRKATAH